MFGGDGGGPGTPSSTGSMLFSFRAAEANAAATRVSIDTAEGRGDTPPAAVASTGGTGSGTAEGGAAAGQGGTGDGTALPPASPHRAPAGSIGSVIVASTGTGRKIGRSGRPMPKLETLHSGMAADLPLPTAGQSRDLSEAIAAGLAQPPVKAKTSDVTTVEL